MCMMVQWHKDLPLCKQTCEPWLFLLWQAHYINNRTMEIFRGMCGLGQTVLAQQVTGAMPPLCEWRKFVYCETATTQIYGEVDHFKVMLECLIGC